MIGIPDRENQLNARSSLSLVERPARPCFGAPGAHAYCCELELFGPPALVSPVAPLPLLDDSPVLLLDEPLPVVEGESSVTAMIELPLMAICTVLLFWSFASTKNDCGTTFTSFNPALSNC